MRKIVLLAPVMFLTSCLSYVDNDLPHTVEMTPPPCVKPYDGYRYKTCEDYTVGLDGMPYVVPEGFDTDFASIPQFLWWKIAPYKANLVGASIVHDHMYACPGNLTRKYIDEVFYSALIASEVPGGDALKMYYAARFAGEPFFKKGVTCQSEVK